MCSVPSLKRQDGTWATSPSEKAAVLQKSFANKSALPPIIENEYAPPPAEPLPVDDVFSVDERWVSFVLEHLRLDSGTGPDQIATKVLRYCGVPLAMPISYICNMIVDQGRWPALWRNHCICFIHKQKSKADAANYKGVHLTSHSSKACARISGPGFQSFVEASETYDPRQFAYMKGSGHRDALLANILQLLWSRETGHVMGQPCQTAKTILSNRLSYTLLIATAAHKHVCVVRKFISSHRSLVSIVL